MPFHDSAFVKSDRVCGQVEVVCYLFHREILETVADILKSCNGPREEAWDATE